MDKKLSDNEIIKALKFAIAQGEPDGIGFWNNNMKWCEFSMQEILDLIHRLQAENETLKSNKFASWKIKFFNLKEEFDKELEEHKEFTKKANAEIERLKEERDTAGYKNNTLIFDKSNLQAKNAELQKQVDELKDICLDCPYKLKFDEIEKQAVKDTAEKFAERVKMAFYYEFDELIPSIMSDKIDEIAREITEGKE